MQYTTNVKKLSIWDRLYNYFHLMRLTKPQPIFLLILPAFWSIALNSHNNFLSNSFNTLYVYISVLLGGILARSAGCVINDIVDRKIDAKVQRTKERMVASGTIGIKSALLLFIVLGVLAVAILLNFNIFSICLGIIAGVLMIIYPFLKKFTYYPQIFLGITFSMGVLMGQAMLDGYLSLYTVLLYLACFFWVVGYDSIYAIQDYKCDQSAGVKSIVVLWGENTVAMVGYCYLMTVFILCAIGVAIHADWIYYSILLLVMLHFIWQVATANIHNPEMAGIIFNYNVYVGILLWIGFLVK